MNINREDLLKKAVAQLRGIQPSRSGKKKQAGIFVRLAQLYTRMQDAYTVCADEAGLTCRGCEDNCCTSFFQHHTYVEWAYLWRGLRELAPERRAIFEQRAREYVEQARMALAVNTLPRAMCPLNEDGLCALYSHRLMICRMHGTRNVFTLPDGRQQIFPGCSRFTQLPCATDAAGERPTLDRTPFYRDLAALEGEFLQRAERPLPKVKLTLAEMIVLGTPKLR